MRGVYCALYSHVLQFFLGPVQTKYPSARLIAVEHTMEQVQAAAKANRLAAAINPADLRSRSVGGGRNALYLTGETVLRCVMVCLQAAF